MTIYQLWTRVKHMFTARHWRGAAIHSPMMYDFVRRYALTNRGERFVQTVAENEGAVVCKTVEQFVSRASGVDGSERTIFVIEQPFLNRNEKSLAESWFRENHAVMAHFQGAMVIIVDKKLKKQRYIIRN